MKKIWILLLIPILLGAGLSSANLNYEVVTQTEYTNNGLTHHEIRANVYNDNNTLSSQSIHVIKKDNTIDTTVWSYVNNEGLLRNQNILTIANDFEEKNPNYEVLAAVNADYFASHATINANMLHGSRLMDPNVHEKYFSIELNKYGNFITTHKKINVGKYYAYLYDETTEALYDVVELLPFNSRSIHQNETAIYYNYSSINNTQTPHYTFDIQQKSIIGDHYMFYVVNGNFKNDKIETTTSKVSIVSKNDHVNTLLEKGVSIKIQKRPLDVLESHTLVGADSQIIEDGTIKSFEGIGGQSASNTTSRHPRTGIGFDSDNNPVLFTVDGRGSNGSQGVNLREFAKIMQSNGVVNGFNLDGGGSTQAAIKKDGVLQMVNYPSDSNPYRNVSNAILFIKPKYNFRVIEMITEDTVELTLPSLNHDVFLNGNKLTTGGVNISIPKDSTINQVISVVNQEHQTTIYQRVFYKTAEVQPMLPEFIVTHNITGTKVEILINFTDPELLIDRMYVIHQSTEERQVALVQYMGLRKATFNELIHGENSFMIYYELKNDMKDEIAYSFNYEVDIEEPVVPDDSESPNSSVYYIIAIITSSLILTALVAVLIVKRKKV